MANILIVALSLLLGACAITGHDIVTEPGGEGSVGAFRMLMPDGPLSIGERVLGFTFHCVIPASISDSGTCTPRGQRIAAPGAGLVSVGTEQLDDGSIVEGFFEAGMTGSVHDAYARFCPTGTPDRCFLLSPDAEVIRSPFDQIGDGILQLFGTIKYGEAKTDAFFTHRYLERLQPIAASQK